MVVQFLDPTQIFTQDVLGLQTDGQRGGFRRDEGIAVAIATDPRTEAQQTGDTDRRLAALVAVHGVQPPFQVAVQHRHRLENGFVEVVQAVLDFVAHLRFETAHLVRFPQGLNLATQCFDHFRALVLVQRRVVELAMGQENAPLRAEQYPALGLGRMSGEHRREAQLIE